MLVVLSYWSLFSTLCEGYTTGRIDGIGLVTSAAIRHTITTRQYSNTVDMVLGGEAPEVTGFRETPERKGEWDGFEILKT